MPTMLGWLSRAAMRASSRKARRTEASWDNAGSMRLSATRRSKPFSPTATASKTSANPPRLISLRARYRPRNIACSSEAVSLQHAIEVRAVHLRDTRRFRHVPPAAIEERVHVHLLEVVEQQRAGLLEAHLHQVLG